MRLFFGVFLMLTSVVAQGKPPSETLLERGKELYLGAASCATCHMPDGKGQPGSVPPLAGSEWLEDIDRSVAISLRGLAGPVKVNGKRYYSAMPPQLLFDDEKLAAILTYVNHAWGNKYGEVTIDQVAEARESLPTDVYTPQALLNAFPFPKNRSKRNGTYELDFDDQLTNVIEPVVYRTFMPGASPAAFAVALPGNHYYCWDAGECRLRYIWTRGGFIRGNRIHWSSNGKPVAEFSGIPYYRARSRLLKKEDYAYLAATNRKEPFYDTTEARDFPIAIESVGSDVLPRFKGYRLDDQGYPIFRYQIADYQVTESLRMNTAMSGVIRQFTVSPKTDLVLRLTPHEDAEFVTKHPVNRDGEVMVPAESSGAFQVEIINLYQGGAK